MASLRNKFEEHLTCSVCLEQLKDPKVLPCLHSFCHGCIVKIAKKERSNNINCPECRKLVQIDNPENPSNLPSNFFVNNLLATMALTDEKKEQKLQCDNCTDENAAATRCEECALFLCSYCSEFHKKSRPTKHHILTTLLELKSGAGPLSVAEKIRCKKHKEEVIKLYCKTCQLTICRDCTIVDHRTHDYGFIEDVAVVQKEILKQNMKEVQQRQAALQRGIASLKRFDQNLVDENAVVVAQVTSHFEELQRVVLSRKNELLLTANSSTNLKRKQIQAQIEVLEIALASCKSSIEFTEKAFKNGNDVQVLSMQKYMLQSLQDLKNVKDVTKPCVTRDLRFNVPQSIQDTKTNFLQHFTVDESLADPDQCQAEITDQGEHLKRDNPATVKITCFDKNKRKVKNGGQVVKADISGVEFNDAMIRDNNDGTHTVTFTPRCGGTLKFEATIDSRPAPHCSLIKDVTWVFNNEYGCGELSDGGVKLKNSRRGCFWRIGECSFETGVHSWKILLQWSHPVYNYEDDFGYVKSTRVKRKTVNQVCIVGVTEAANYLRSTYAHKVCCKYDVVTTITVTLDIQKSNLLVKVEDKNNAQDEMVKRLPCNGETQFWPYVQCYDDMEVTLKFE